MTLLRSYVDVVRNNKRVWPGGEYNRVGERLPRRIIRWVEEEALLSLPQFVVLLCQAMPHPVFAIVAPVQAAHAIGIQPDKGSILQPRQVLFDAEPAAAEQQRPAGQSLQPRAHAPGALDWPRLGPGRRVVGAVHGVVVLVPATDLLDVLLL